MEVSFNVKCKDKEQRKKIRLLLNTLKKDNETMAECLLRVLEGDK